jgi:HSP20 family protein
MLPTLFYRTRQPQSFSPFEALRDEFDRLIQRGDNHGEPSGVYGTYPVDIREDDDHVYVDAEMPGFKTDEIDVTIEKGVLSIEAKRVEDEAKEGTTHLKQRRYTRINRRFTLPKTVDENKVNAKLEHGVLHLTLTKREEVRPRKIQVN